MPEGFPRYTGTAHRLATMGTFKHSFCCFKFHRSAVRVALAISLTILFSTWLINTFFLIPSKKCNKRHLMETKYKKFASKMPEDLFKQLKMVSAIEDKQFQQLLEEAVTQYLEKYKVTEKKSDDGEWTVRFSIAPKVSTDQNEEPE